VGDQLRVMDRGEHDRDENDSQQQHRHGAERAEGEAGRAGERCDPYPAREEAFHQTSLPGLEGRLQRLCGRCRNSTKRLPASTSSRSTGASRPGAAAVNGAYNGAR
jgi:hypothetical protein